MPRSSGQHPLRRSTISPSNCASWCGCASGSFRTWAIGSVSCTGLLDLCFPEFTRHVRNLDTDLARGILREFPTAQAIGDCTVGRLARHRCGRRTVGTALARELVQAAKASIGRHQGELYSRQVRFLCEDAVVLATRIRELDSEIETKARQHEIAALLSTIDGLGILTAAHVVAEVADPAAFRSAAALAAYVGVAPGTKQSGRWQPRQVRLSMIGNARLRRALWMPTLAAVRCNPWLAAHYQRLREKGKPPKVALIAAMRKLLTAVYSVAKNRKPFTHTQSRRADGISTAGHGPGSGAAPRSPRPPPRGSE